MTKEHQPSIVFPGSFDPLHQGHVDLARRVSKIFDVVIMAVIENPSKQPLFTAEERIAMIAEEFKSDHNIKVDSFSGLLVDYLKKYGNRVVVRGLRAITDYDYEAQMALMNKIGRAHV